MATLGGPDRRVLSNRELAEKHLYELCVAHELDDVVPEDRKDGKLNRYIDGLYRHKKISQRTMTRLSGPGVDRNNAAHGALDLLEPDSGTNMLRRVREFVARHPIPPSQP